MPNPSFETYSNCPQFTTGCGDFNYAIPWFRVYCSPDYFNVCDPTPKNLGVPVNFVGHQNAHSGVAYAGCFVLDLPLQNNDGREYIEVQLLDTLRTGVRYRVQFFVSLADTMQYAITTVGAYFSPMSIASTDLKCLPYTPQAINKPSNPLTDKSNWVTVSDTFTATGNELFMVIGNFNKDSLSDTTYVGGGGWGIGASYYYIDDVAVYPDSLTGITEPEKDISVRTYPNPFITGTTLTFNRDVKSASLRIYNVLGKPERQMTFSGKELVIERGDLPAGIYFYRIETSDGPFGKGKLVIQ